MTSTLSIKDLEQLSGVKAHTLRIWEQRYGILKPQRTATNIRFYSNEDLKRILNISLLNSHGYKISVIAKLTDAELVKEAEKFLNSFQEESVQIENLVMSLMEVNEERFEKTVNNAILHFGFENTIEKIVFPFFKKLGAMWQAGMVNPAQEHYLSNLIRQKIIVHVDKISPNITPDQKSVVLFLPSGELHEMGLLYTSFLCKARGYRVIYLGQSVPIEDIKIINDIVKPDLMISIITSKLNGIDLNAYFQLLSESAPNCQFLMSGRLVFESGESYRLPPKNFKVFEEYSDLKSLL